MTSSVGRYLKKLLGAKHVGVVATAGTVKREGVELGASLQREGVGSTWATFGGMCSHQEVDRIVACFQASGLKLDGIVAAGGGSCNDTGKVVAARLGCPTVVFSTLAATDAPCSALSIMYTPEGGYAGGIVYPQSPNIVIVDTDIIAKAPLRTLVSGFGDALSTFYEARTCYENPRGLSMLEARPTVTALAMGELCAKLLYQHADEAVRGFGGAKSTAALERVVEANTLLSGLGFESGGLAASHAVAQGLSWVKSVHDNHLHGEMVAIGLLTQLALEQEFASAMPERLMAIGASRNRAEELQQVSTFMACVGLPVCFDQIHFDPQDANSVDTFAEVCLSQWFAHNEPFDVTREAILKAMWRADSIGRQVVKAQGDEAYRALHK